VHPAPHVAPHAPEMLVQPMRQFAPQVALQFGPMEHRKSQSSAHWAVHWPEKLVHVGAQDGAGPQFSAQGPASTQLQADAVHAPSLPP
jgi:hypothetical protein